MGARALALGSAGRDGSLAHPLGEALAVFLVNFADLISRDHLAENFPLSARPVLAGR